LLACATANRLVERPSMVWTLGDAGLVSQHSSLLLFHLRLKGLSEETPNGHNRYVKPVDRAVDTVKIYLGCVNGDEEINPNRDFTYRLQSPTLAKGWASRVFNNGGLPSPSLSSSINQRFQTWSQVIYNATCPSALPVLSNCCSPNSRSLYLIW